MGARESILVVEDRVLDREVARRFSEALGLECALAQSTEEAQALLATRAWNFALVDLHLTSDCGTETRAGIGLIADIRKRFPSTAVLALSADPRHSAWQEASRAGAFLFLKKPLLSCEELAFALETATQKKWHVPLLENDWNTALFPPALLQECPEGIVVDSSTQTLVRRLAADACVPVIVCGERGTGRDEIARLLHRTRSASEGDVPFVKVDCSQTSAEALGRALFGYLPATLEPGASRSFGALALSFGGILYLDNIEAAPQEVQDEIAKALAEGLYVRRGDGKSMACRFQLVCSCATSTDKAALLGQLTPRLRERLVGAEIRLLPLRMRTFEMRTFIRVFLARRGLTLAESTLGELTERCKRYHWQGNVRELFSILHIFLVLNDSNTARLDMSRFPEIATMFAPPLETVETGSGEDSQAAKPGAGETTEESSVTTFVGQAGDVPAGAVPASMGTPKETHTGTGTLESHPAVSFLANALNRDVPIHEVMVTVEKHLLDEAIKRHGMNMSHVCVALRMPRSTLNLKRRQHGLP